MMKRDLGVCLCALVMGAALLLGIFRGDAIETGAWGLSFREAGQAPVGNAGADALAQYDAAYVDDTDEKVLYLTFDAGYEAGFTAGLLDVLKAHEAPAAFFLVGSYLERNPELVKRMVNEGHTVGNHTAHHYDMSRISDPQVFRQELQSVEEQFEAITGEPMPRFYRPPQGVYSTENLTQAKELGYRTVFWSLAYVDWKADAQPTREEAFSKLIPRVHPGAVVLLHATSETNGQILDELLTQWEAMGYRFAALEELFD